MLGGCGQRASLFTEIKAQLPVLQQDNRASHTVGKKSPATSRVQHLQGLVRGTPRSDAHTVAFLPGWNICSPLISPGRLL